MTHHKHHHDHTEHLGLPECKLPMKHPEELNEVLVNANRGLPEGALICFKAHLKEKRHGHLTLRYNPNVVNRTEVLGRLYWAGFELVEERIHKHRAVLVARKTGEPHVNDSPTRSRLIALNRVGKDGCIIKVYKLRTMYRYAEYLQPYVYQQNSLGEGGKFANDFRITRMGRWMRKCWIDEIPMLWNIVRGELKLIGVRPLSQHYLSLYTPEMQRLHVSVKPGLLPPFYAEKVRPRTIGEVQQSERAYIEAYRQHPFMTDLRYLLRILHNIVLRGARSK